MSLRKVSACVTGVILAAMLISSTVMAASTDAYLVREMYGDDVVALQEALTRLPETEASLIRLRYFKNHTQSQAGQILGMSQVQVSRLEKKVLIKLRKEMTQE